VAQSENTPSTRLLPVLVNMKKIYSLSVTIITKDEADRIERCLESVKELADEIIVFDSGSTDDTLKIVRRYTDKINENLTFFDPRETMSLLHRADVMISDNSSLLYEFLLLGKPVVTYRNRAPKPCMINITTPAELEKAIPNALNPSPELFAAIKAYGPSVTPYLDGRSAGRILYAMDEILNSGWKDKKPRNFLRNFKMRRQLKYFKF